MLSFLPQNNRKVIITEYLSRIFIVFLNFSFIGLIILIALFVPSSIFSKYKSATVKNQLETVKIASSQESQDPVELIKKINAMVSILSKEDTTPILMSDMIQKIVDLKNKDIKITAINIAKDLSGMERISVSGVGKTRDSLTTFNKDLKD